MHICSHTRPRRINGPVLTSVYQANYSQVGWAERNGKEGGLIGPSVLRHRLGSSTLELPKKFFFFFTMSKDTKFITINMTLIVF